MLHFLYNFVFAVLNALMKVLPCRLKTTASLWITLPVLAFVFRFDFQCDEELAMLEEKREKLDRKYRRFVFFSIFFLLQ